LQNLKSIAHFDKYVITSTATLKDALHVMQNNKNGCVVLVENRKAVGILTESDFVNYLAGNTDLNIPALNLASKKLITLNENSPIDVAFDTLSEFGIRRIILVDTDLTCKGIVFQEDLFDYLEEDVYKIDLKISHIIKPNQKIIALHVNNTLEDALRIMQDRVVGSVIVKEGEKYVGIITEKDILRLTYNEIDLKEDLKYYMTSPVVSIEKDALVMDAIDIMRSKQIRRVVVHDENNSIVALLTNRDILKHIKGNYTRILQIKIKHAQEVMDFLPEAIVEIVESDSYFMLQWMNIKAKEFFGEHLLEHSIENIVPDDIFSFILAEIQKNNFVENIPLSVGTRTYDLSAILSKNLNNRYIKLIFKDVSDHERRKKELEKEVNKQIKKRLENEYLLMQRSKLSTMGEMIGHIAHQWRQPLAELGGIFMNIDAANKFDEIDKEFLDTRIRTANELIKHMSNTIDDFRHFFEPNRSKTSFDLEKYMENAINIIRASLTFHHIKLSCIYPKEKIIILGYPSEFSQVILNILANAKDVLIQREIKNPQITLHVKADKDSATIEIEDNAGGIDKKIMKDIFDIYFTTKGNNEGTGLGLYMSKLIIESKLNGKLSVKNGKYGANFKIEIVKIP